MIVSPGRNQTKTERSYYIGCEYNRRKGERGGARDGAGRGKKSKDQNDPLVNIAELIASEEKVGSATVKRAAKFAQHIDSMGRAFDWLKCSPRSNIARCDIWARASVQQSAGGLRQSLAIQRVAIGSAVQGVR